MSPRRFLRRLTASLTRRRDEDRLREEVEEYLDLQTAENIRAGMDVQEARRQARLKFGPVEAVKEQYRDTQSLPFVDGLVRDLRFALRLLRKSPAFTVTAILSLAVGIGANAAIFTLVDRVMLRTLPVEDPHQLVYVSDQRILQQSSPRFSYPFYVSIRDADIMNGVAARFTVPLNTTLDDGSARVRGELVSGNYFGVVGVTTRLGRPIAPSDDRTPGAHPVAVIATGFWQRSLGSDPAVIGREVRINERPFTIIGVAAPGFTGTDVGQPTDIWLPMMMQKEVGRDLLNDARTNWLEMIGRMKPGVTFERASAELTGYLQNASATAGDQQASRIVLQTAAKGSVPLRRQLGPSLTVLLLLTGLGLLLACVNVASLLVVRSVAREREIAVRLAIGASRAHLVWQLVTETLVLAAFGAAAGLLVAPSAAALLISSQSDRFSIESALDVRVFLFGLAVASMAGLVVALAPILASRKIAAGQICRQPAGAASGSSRRLSLHGVIVTAQMAMSLAMLISAALLVQSFRNVSTIDPGFQADELLLISVDAAATGYDAQRRWAFWRDALGRLNGLPRVSGASVARTSPFDTNRQRQRFASPASGERIEVDVNTVGPGYFRTLGIPLVNGREFSDQDGGTSRPVVIVNDRLADMFWPNRNPVGTTITTGQPDSPAPEIVGVVKSAKYRDLAESAGPMLYVPVLQAPTRDVMTLHVRAKGEATALAADVRRELLRLDPNVPHFAIRTLEDQLNSYLGQRRQAAFLSSGFAILALLLSTIGVYGVTALAVSRQTHEIGVRIALGARPNQIVQSVSRRGVIQTLIGLALGLAISLAFTRVTGALLYGITPGDLVTFVAMSALLAAAALIAIYIPARAATRLDAVTAIRCD
jgi:predicted permease